MPEHSGAFLASLWTRFLFSQKHNDLLYIQTYLAKYDSHHDYSDKRIQKQMESWTESNERDLPEVLAHIDSHHGIQAQIGQSQQQHRNKTECITAVLESVLAFFQSHDFTSLQPSLFNRSLTETYYDTCRTSTSFWSL